MDGQLLAVWIGLGLTLLLGLVNFLWGPAILKDRERVIITNAQVVADYSPEENRLGLDIFCSLVLNRGDKELQVDVVSILFNAKAYNSLRQFFNLPRGEKLTLPQGSVGKEDGNHHQVRPVVLLWPKKPVDFSRKVFFEKNDRSKGELPDIQPWLDQIGSEYKICWRRYDSKKVCWSFPNRWWRNLGKKLWG